jgi:alpha-L-fucosidase 2
VGSAVILPGLITPQPHLPEHNMALLRRPLFTRRSLLAAAAALPLTGASGLAASAPRRALERADHLLWYRRPAMRWEEALPLGNGRLGAMVFGRVGQERLQLNEDTLWAGGPYTPDSPDALAALPEVRRLLDEGRYKEATDLASGRMMARPLWQMAYGSLGDLLLDFDGAEAPRAYHRELDLDTAIATLRHESARASVRREVFVSAPDQVVVLNLQAARGRIAFELGYRGPRKAKYDSPDYQGAATVLMTDQPVDWLQREAVGSVHPDSVQTVDERGALLVTGRNEPGPDTASGLTYAMRVKIVTDGRVEVTPEGRLRVSGARNATLLIAAATSYVNFRDTSGDPVASVRRHTEAAAAKPYATLRRDHVRDQQSLYRRFTLDLGRTAAAGLPTDERIAAAEKSDDPALAALYLQYGRYLLIASSRPGTQPANLQGLWNEGVNPPWGSKYTININTEMNYWPADAAALGDCVEPLLRMVEELAITGAQTARTMYGARGWVAHHNTDLWRAAAPIDGPLWGLWPCGGAWLCNTLWDHWDHQRDAALLQRLYPLLKGASQFFLDTLVKDRQGRGLVTSPSLSPENWHPHGSSLCAGPAMDRQILRDLFDRTVHAGKLLRADAEFLDRVAAARSALAPDRIGGQGQLQEWLEDWDAGAPDQQHRHVSHLYAVYPSSQINVRDTPELLDAAKASLRKRGDLATGWGTAWRLCLWARMGEGDHAHHVLKMLLGPQRSYPNMLDAHPPFQIDGNFGGAAGVLEMLVQSWGGELHLLPALPQAWPRGAVRGMRVRGAVDLDIEWRDGRPTRLSLHGPAGTEVVLRHRGKRMAVMLDHRGNAELGAQAFFRQS